MLPQNGWLFSFIVIMCYQGYFLPLKRCYNLPCCIVCNKVRRTAHLVEAWVNHGARNCDKLADVDLAPFHAHSLLNHPPLSKHLGAQKDHWRSSRWAMTQETPPSSRSRQQQALAGLMGWSWVVENANGRSSQHSFWSQSESEVRTVLVESVIQARQVSTSCSHIIDITYLTCFMWPPLNWAPIFEWYMAWRLVGKIGY